MAQRFLLIFAANFAIMIILPQQAVFGA